MTISKKGNQHDAVIAHEDDKFLDSGDIGPKPGIGKEWEWDSIGANGQRERGKVTCTCIA